MISRTKPLRLKTLLAKKLNVGQSRVRFTDATWKILFKEQKGISHNLVRQIIKAKAYKLVPCKKRTYKIYYGKVKRSDPKVTKRDKLKPTNKLSYLLKRKILSNKKIWVKKIREMRSYLKSKKQMIGSKKYRIMRSLAKGNRYNSVKDIENKL